MSSSYASSSRHHASYSGGVDSMAPAIDDDYLCALMLQMQLIPDDRTSGHLGKQVTESDAQFAIDLQLREMEEMEQSLKLAKSLATCGHVPEDLLGQILEQDSLVSSDRELALQISRGDPSVLRTVEASTASFHTALQHFHAIAECCSCGGDDKRTYRAPCGHDYCQDCAYSLYSAALKDRALIPVRCCKQPFADEVFRACLTAESERSKYEMIKGEIEHPCPPVEELDVAASRLIVERGWKVCPRCGAVIERKEGCVHITCVCRYEFCYTCTRRWQTCTCELYPAAEINQILNERIGNQDAGNARHRLRNVLRNYYGHNHDWERQALEGRVCNMCNWNMPLYCFHCNVCRETRCFRCCYNR